MKGTPAERQTERAPTPLAVLMLDGGWQVRQRGPGWGRKKTRQPRVEWHEWKTGVFYRHEQSGRTAGGRGVLSEKIVIGWQGEPAEFGRRLHWEALRGGLGRAYHRLVAGDGAPWIWNLAQDRWAGRHKCWTSTTPASTSGNWAGRCRARMKSPLPGGSNPGVTDCATAGRNACSKRSRDWQCRRAQRPRTKLLCESSRADELPGPVPVRLADRLWAGRIGVSAEAMPVQTTGPVLDGSRYASSGRAGQPRRLNCSGSTLIVVHPTPSSTPIYTESIKC